MPVIYFEFPVKEIWLSPDDFDGYDTESYEYEYDYSILQEEIVNLLVNDYAMNVKHAHTLCSDLDLWDILEDYYEDVLDDILKERLYDEAYEEYCDYKSYED